MIKQLLLEALERFATGFFVGLGFVLAALIVLALWALPLPALADGARVYGGGYSYHLASDDVVNESHDFAAGQYGPWVAGRFNNSHGRESYFAVYEWNWRPVMVLPHLQTFMWGGVVRGYTSCKFDGGRGNSKVCAMAVGGVRWTEWQIEPASLIVGDAATLAASWRF